MALAIAAAGPAMAETEGGLGFELEMAGHRALARTRADAEIAPFQTDGCSGGMSSIWAVSAQVFPVFRTVHGALPPWEACCVTHDRAYHAAGPDPDPTASYRARRLADAALRACVVATAEGRLPELAKAYGVDETLVKDGYALISEAMYEAVRAGGAPCSGLAWRWGYGYPSCAVGLGDFSADTPAE